MSPDSRFFINPAVRALDWPTLLIRGARSDVLPAATLQAMRDSNGQACMAEVADASHSVYDDQGEVFNRLVVAFLERLERPGR
ncbi:MULTISPECIES: alpha/beta fold hydrolase [Pseudomonas]|jgi:pimeloyl-ACP methyl ester carboxylesterase|uniref:alpha/beta fold hydrolase n=1 Tax=Pseudomonas TaxID=286 RepID=UPI003494A2DD